jgi:pimeloyl-ACP methyl ester carboxylesterase
MFSNIAKVQSAIADLFIFYETKISRMHQKQITINGHATPYLQSSSRQLTSESTKLPIIMAHGFGGDRFNFVRYARHLNVDYHCIIPDLIGFGNSERQQGYRYSIQAYTDSLLDFMDQLDIERAHVVGNSLGGHISLLLAAQHPQRVASLILYSPAGLKQSEHHWSLEHRKAGDHPVNISCIEDFNYFIDTNFVKKPFLPSPIKRALAAKAISDRVFFEKIWGDIIHETPGNPLMEPMLPTMLTPTLVVWGEQDKMLPVSDAYKFSQLMPNCRVEILQNCGHVPMLERPAEMAGVTIDFIKGIQ